MPEPVALLFNPSGTPTSVVPSSGTSNWVVVIEDTGLRLQDAENLRSREEISDGTRKVFTRDLGIGTTIQLRIRYRAAAVEADEPGPLIKLFGSYDNVVFAPLRNLMNDVLVEIPYDVDNDPSYTESPPPTTTEVNLTVPDNMAHSWDCNGCKYFIVGVQRAVLGDDEEPGLFLEAKIV